MSEEYEFGPRRQMVRGPKQDTTKLRPRCARFERQMDMDGLDDIADDLRREHGRNVADIVATMSDRAWARGWRYGWIIGFVAGVMMTVASYGLARWMGWL